ncbi:MAG: acetate kinase [Candidatus Borkfalkiaceae bacterium]|nr:acetate kinase [Clostridia bacterium]MDY6223438.1 acetate kinase [Christensenellaceae bacterium]
MKILVVNAGSSSLKYQLFDMDKGAVLAKGNCERIGIDGVVTHKRPQKADYKTSADFPDHRAAIECVLKLLTDKDLGVISDVKEIGAVGHRFAHGGEIRKSTLLGDREIEYLESIADLNPLHGPPAISGFKACKEVMPYINHVGVFDTSYYSDMKEEAFIYPIPYELYEEYKIRRYGFHGTSHRYVAAKAAELLGNRNAKIITCHLGNGSSVTATMNGKAIDTSMGFTPQDGVPMGTRSGAIDPTVPLYVMKKKGLTVEETEKLLNNQSGLLGVSGVSSDCRDVETAAENGNARAQLALKILIHNIRKIIGSYIAEMNGADAIVFTAGIGENDSSIRAGVCADMTWLGVGIDEELNANCPRGECVEISGKGAKVRTFVIPTNEEYMIALDTLNLSK